MSAIGQRKGMNSKGAMKQPEHRKTRDASLREAAERQLAPARRSPAPPAGDLLHELQVHQIELQLQNETLREAQKALEESRDRYVDLYEFAPVGYLNLSPEGVIEQINLAGAALLCKERGHLLKRRFASFVHPEDRDRWERHFLRAMQSNANASDSDSDSIELALQRDEGTRADMQINCARAAAGSGALRIALIDITARKRAEEKLFDLAARLEDTVNKRTRQLRVLSAQMTLIEEHERRMLGQELHDNLSQLLAAIKIKLSLLDKDHSPALVGQIAQLVNEADYSTRTIMRELSPTPLRTLGLMPAFEQLAEEMRRLYGLAVHIHNDAGLTQLEPIANALQSLLYRSVRELLINVAKHAKVQEAGFFMRRESDQLMFVVSDDGCGFDPASFLGAQSGKRHFGLNSIRERMLNLGAEMEIDSSPGKGTTVALRVPRSIETEEHLAS